MKRRAWLIVTVFCLFSAKAQIQITVDATKEIKEISPYIYGKNQNVPEANLSFLKESGLKFIRGNGGNNSTKFNWEKQLTSHPDWYNNVYDCKWNEAARKLHTDMPAVKGMWAFQLLGHVAKTNQFNFADWDYNRSQWWTGVTNNWCAGGDTDKYLQEWPAESTVGILTHWFDNLKLNKEQFRYWNMDNEPECWHSTHDDIMKQPIAAEEYIQRYVAVALKARALFPEIKIVGPSFTNEWFWYNWQTGLVPDLVNPNKKYPWVEYFIKRIAEEQKRTGVRLLDVLDFHAYLEDTQEMSLQLHRIFYDTTYDYPGANGVKVLNGGWDNSITKEYIFKRSNDWLDQYMGVGHGVTMGLSELGALYGQDPNVIAVCYASLLGTFGENNVEIFTPWDWYVGQWEVLHLFTKYAGTTAVSSVSSKNNLVSAYSSLNEAKNILSVMIVNRDVANNQSVSISMKTAVDPTEKASCYQLSNLPATETFVSATQNAIKSFDVSVNNKSIELTLPKLSVTAIQIPLGPQTSIAETEKALFQLYPNPAKHQFTLETSGLPDGTVLTICDVTGKVVKRVELSKTQLRTSITIDELNSGLYIVTLSGDTVIYSQKLIVE